MTCRQIIWVCVRLLALALLVWGAIYIGDQVKDALGIEILPHNEAMAYKVILLSILVYTVLLAIPFVPGAEIGVTLLAVFGASVAPIIYGATVAGLCLAFLVGRTIPAKVTCRFLRRIGQVRTADLITAIEVAPPRDREDILLSLIDHPALRQVARRRYIALALLINTPGNVVLGGGGGLSLLAGLSLAYSPLGFFATVAIAVAPVPFAMMAFGTII